MRILVTETWDHYWYGQVWVDRLGELGYEALGFVEGGYFRHASAWRGSLRKAQCKYRFGPALLRLNLDLLARISQYRPDCVLFVRGDLILPGTLRRIHRWGIVTLGYNNDDPFSPRQAWYAWRLARRGMREYDHCFVYRQSNVKEYSRAGCKSASLLRSFYIKEHNYPILPCGERKTDCDVAFAGHWEDDGRDGCVQKLLESGVSVKLAGPFWSRARNYSWLRKRLGDISPVLGPAYNAMLNNCKIALVFLSKINNDSYTRRCFEIPAAETFMLSEFSQDLCSLFNPGSEADYFVSPEDLAAKVKFYLKHDGLRSEIAAAGRRRLLRDGHEALDRARVVVSVAQEHVARRRER